MRQPLLCLPVLCVVSRLLQLLLAGTYSGLQHITAAVIDQLLTAASVAEVAVRNGKSPLTHFNCHVVTIAILHAAASADVSKLGEPTSLLAEVQQLSSKLFCRNKLQSAA